MKEIYNHKEFYCAHLARDPRFDGKFVVAVKSTMIYCRPVCPARKAKLQNLTFFIHAAQAEEAGCMTNETFLRIRRPPNFSLN